jgi:hypothetical protein
MRILWFWGGENSTTLAKMKILARLMQDDVKFDLKLITNN